jgi:hypothetical protein
MLSSEEVAQLAGAICATAETLGQTISAGAAKMMAEDLAGYPIEHIRSALQACRRELTGKLTLSAILQRIQAEDGRPGKDEAWAIALASSDEFETVVMTDEIQVALSAARPVLDAGDKIGARMAFMSAYERLLINARAELKPVNWHMSIGFDAARRVAAVTAAVQMQRIPRDHGQMYLADLSHVPITDDGRAIAGLLTGDVVEPSPLLRQKLKGLKDQMLEARKASEEEKLEIKIKAANDLADRQALLIRQAQGVQA